jgi:hypothetical protein
MRRLSEDISRLIQIKPALNSSDQMTIVIARIPISLSVRWHSFFLKFLTEKLIFSIHFHTSLLPFERSIVHITAKRVAIERYDSLILQHSKNPLY